MSNHDSTPAAPLNAEPSSRLPRALDFRDAVVGLTLTMGIYAALLAWLIGGEQLLHWLVPPPGLAVLNIGVGPAFLLSMGAYYLTLLTVIIRASRGWPVGLADQLGWLRWALSPAACWVAALLGMSLLAPQALGNLMPPPLPQLGILALLGLVLAPMSVTLIRPQRSAEDEERAARPVWKGLWQFSLYALLGITFVVAFCLAIGLVVPAVGILAGLDCAIAAVWTHLVSLDAQERDQPYSPRAIAGHFFLVLIFAPITLLAGGLMAGILLLAGTGIDDALRAYLPRGVWIGLIEICVYLIFGWGTAAYAALLTLAERADSDLAKMAQPDESRTR